MHDFNTCVKRGKLFLSALRDISLQSPGDFSSGVSKLCAEL